ncbi:MAG: PQQ-like beta-propeller repeat protein, partial [Candidatus Spechtbacteria bacterium]|nr:PQQ-like beta-propeller repeat protein [Candidatus Spechtbacteria bacterium]
WSFGQASPGAQQFSVAIDSQGRVYTAVKNKVLYALKGDDGSIIWSYTLADEPRGIAIGDGRVYIASYDGKVYAFGE